MIWGGIFLLSFLFWHTYFGVKYRSNKPNCSQPALLSLMFHKVHMVYSTFFFFVAVDSFLQGILFLVSAALYLCQRQEYLSFYVLCLALSWVNLLYFSRGDIHMGIYSVMIQKVVHRGHTSPQWTCSLVNDPISDLAFLLCRWSSVTSCAFFLSTSSSCLDFQRVCHLCEWKD